MLLFYVFFKRTVHQRVYGQTVYSHQGGAYEGNENDELYFEAAWRRKGQKYVSRHQSGRDAANQQSSLSTGQKVFIKSRAANPANSFFRSETG